MKIVVAVKQVLSSNTNLEIDESKTKVQSRAPQYVTNEADKYAVEAAVQLKKQVKGDLTAITLGQFWAKDSLVEAIAKGADRGILVQDDINGSSDPFVTARILATAIKPLSPDLLMFGVQAEDDAFSLVGTYAATFLKLPHVSAVTGIQPSGQVGNLRVQREMGGGVKETLELTTPALVTVQFGIVPLRYVPVVAVMQAKRKEVTSIAASKLLQDNGVTLDSTPRLKTLSLSVPQRKRAEIFAGPPAEASRALLKQLKDVERVI